MPKIIKLTDANGVAVYVNAEQIRFFRASGTGCSIAFGGAGNDKLRLIVAEKPEQVRAAIDIAL